MNKYIWIPEIIEETSAGNKQVALQSKLLMNRNIFLNGDINNDSANFFIQQLMYLEYESDEPINVLIDTPGGLVTSGLAIYDVIQDCKVPINMVCIGTAASMGAVILAGGQKGRRYILPHSKCMIHEPLISNGVGGSATSIHNISESILKTRDITNGILAKHTGKKLSQINKATAFDNYMTASEAVEFGICDKVIKGLSEINRKAG